MSQGISSIPEEDYVLSRTSNISLVHFFQQPFHDDFLWLRVCFADYCKFANIKCFHSSAFRNFVEAIKKDQCPMVKSNLDKRRFFNLFVYSLQIGVKITEDILDVNSNVSFYKVGAKREAPEFVKVGVKGSEYVHRVVAENIVKTSVTMTSLIQIGGGLQPRLEADNWDLNVGKDINDFPLDLIPFKSFISHQSSYHIKPTIMQHLVKRPFTLTSSFLSELALNHKSFLDDVSIINGVVGDRVVKNEYGYHPAYFSKRGFLLFTSFTINPKHPMPFIATNMLKAPKIIPFAVAKSIKVRCTSITHRVKPPKVVELNDDIDFDQFASCSFYQSKKIDGNIGLLHVVNRTANFIDRTGNFYELDVKIEERGSYNFYVEAILASTYDYKKPIDHMEFYLISVDEGDFIWKDVALVREKFSFIGNKEYRMIPYGKTISLDNSPIPSDGVVYSPVLSNFKKTLNGKRSHMSIHYFFKTCPTSDVTFSELKQLGKESRNLVFMDNGKEFPGPRLFANHHESILSMPFLYEVSSYVMPEGEVKYVVNHVRMDKKNYDYVIKEPSLNARNEKGVFFYTKLGVDYYDSVKNFYSSLSKHRRLLPFSFCDNQSEFYMTMIHLIYKKFEHKDGLITLDCMDIYTFLKTVTSPFAAMLFIDLTGKNSSVSKKNTYKNGKISTVFVFNATDFSGVLNKTLPKVNFPDFY